MATAIEEAVIAQKTAVGILQDLIEEYRQQIDSISAQKGVLLSKSVAYDGRQKAISTLRKKRSQQNRAMTALSQRQQVAEAAYYALRRACTELLPLLA